MKNSVNPSARLQPGDHFPPRQIRSVLGADVPVPDPDRIIHLQFRRFAGCPVCSLHLREFGRRQRELAGRGVREVVVFAATGEALLAHHAEMPFPLVADPDRRLYREFGVESSPVSLLHPAVWRPALRGAFARGVTLPENTAGALGLPADLLIAPDGSVLASHYGRHADDQWSCDEVLALAERFQLSPVMSA